MCWAGSAYPSKYRRRKSMIVISASIVVLENVKINGSG